MEKGLQEGHEDANAAERVAIYVIVALSVHKAPDHLQEEDMMGVVARRTSEEDTVGWSQAAARSRMERDQAGDMGRESN